MYIRVHLLTANFCYAKTSLLRGTTDIPVRNTPYILEKSTFENRRSRC